jgi:hypothetical protein
MGLFNFSKASETPIIERPKVSGLKRVPSEKNDGHWAPREEEVNYEDKQEILEKIHNQRAKEFSEIIRRAEENKN